MFFVSPIHFFLDQYYSRVLAHNSYFKERPKSRLWPDSHVIRSSTPIAALGYTDPRGRIM